MMYAYRQRYLVLLLALGLAPVWLWLAYHGLTLQVDRREMLSPQSPARRDWRAFRDEFNYRNDFMVLAYDSNRNPGAQTAIQQLGRRLEEDPLFQNVFFKIDSPALAEGALYFVSLEQLKEIEKLLAGAGPWLHYLAQPDGLTRLVEHLGSPQATPILAAQLGPYLGVVLDVVEALANNMQGTQAYTSPFAHFGPEVEMLAHRSVRPGQREFFYTLADGRTFVLMAQPRRSLDSSEYTSSLAALQALESHLAEVRKSHPTVDSFITGEAALETAEVKDVIEDVAYCGLLGTLLLGLGTLSVVRCPRALGCIAVANLVSVSWLLGLDSLAGPLNILTAQHLFLFGLASLWWTFHTTMRFLLQLRHTGCAEQAWSSVAASWSHEARWFLSASLLLWLSLIVAGGPSLASLGYRCLLAILVVALEVGVVLPALIAVAFHHDPVSTTAGDAFQGPSQWMRSIFWLGQRRGLPRVAQALCLLTLLGLPKVSLDSNLLNLPAPGMACKQVENYLQPLGYSTLYAYSVANSVEQAEIRRRQLLAHISVGRVESITQLLPPKLEEKQAVVKRILARVKQLPLPHPAQPRDAARLLSLYRAFQQADGNMQNALKHLSSSKEQVGQRAQSLKSALARMRGRIDLNNPGPVEEGLSRYEGFLMEDLRSLLKLLSQQSLTPPQVLQQIPPSIRARTVSPSGKILLRIYPARDCWAYPALQGFVTDLREVDPEATGTPALLYDFLLEIKNGLRRGLLLFVGLALAGTLIMRKPPGASTHGHSGATSLSTGIILRVIWGPPRVGYPIAAGLFCLGLAGVVGLELNGLNLWMWLLSLHLGWLYSLALAASSRTNSVEPVFLAGSFLLVALIFLALASHMGVKSCGAMLALGILCQLLTSLAWPRAYWMRFN